MIRNNLSLLLAERNLKATKVSNDTGIARSTLSKIVNNTSEKIDYATINSLCNYLKITPGDFFEYSPFEVRFHFDINNQLDTERNQGINIWKQTIYTISAFINFLEYGNTEIANIEYEGSVIENNFPFIDNDGTELTSWNIHLSPALGSSTKPLNDVSITFQTKITTDFREALLAAVQSTVGENMAYSIDLKLF